MSEPTIGPVIQASVSTVWSSELAFVSSSSGTRFGSPANAAGRKKPVATPGDCRERDDDRRAVGERKRGEDSEACEVRADHEPPSREPVDERSEQEPDEDDRKEVGDEEAGDPDRRSGELLDVERQRDGGDVRPEARPCGGEEEEPEGGRAAKETETAVHGHR